MKSRLRLLLWLIVAAAIVAVLVYAFMPAPVAVDLAEVTRGPLQVTVDEDGKTRVKERYVVSAPLAGQLLRIELDSGDKVYAGQTLIASITPADPKLLDPRDLSEAEARVQVAQANAEQATARLKAVEEAQHLADQHLRRVKPLHARGVVTDEELDEREHQARITAENVHAAEFAKKVAAFEVKLAEAALVRTRSASDEDAADDHFKIHSPVDGHVLRVIQKSATVVGPGTPLIEVGDANDLEVEADVLSADAARIRLGAKVRLEHWGGDKPLEGRVRVIEPSGFTKVSALGVEEQRVNIIIDLVDPPAARATLGDGYRVEARIVVWEENDVLQVPAGALFRVGADWAVYVVVNNTAVLRTIEVGHNNGVAAQVVGGLEPGDTVILHPSDRVTDGTPVVSRGR